MVKTRQWDEDFLRDREAAEEEAAFAQRCDADRRRAVRQMNHEVSEVLRGFTVCPMRRCRRARRCEADAAEFCRAKLRGGLPADVARRLTDEVYAELQVDRRDAAEAEQ